MIHVKYQILNIMMCFWYIHTFRRSCYGYLAYTIFCIKIFVLI